VCDLSASRAAIVAPYAGPYKVLVKGGEDLHSPSRCARGRKFVSLDILKAHTISGPVSPAVQEHFVVILFNRYGANRIENT
jgi:hypothetical protein